MRHYRLYNHKTGEILYLLNIVNDPEVDHESRLEKKKVEIGYSKNVVYNDMSWETTIQPLHITPIYQQCVYLPVKKQNFKFNRKNQLLQIKINLQFIY